jgi:hypothetical protein
MRPVGKPQTMMPESAAELAVSDSHENRHEPVKPQSRRAATSETPAAIPMMSANSWLKEFYFIDCVLPTADAPICGNRKRWRD